MRTTMRLGAGLLALALSACRSADPGDTYLDAIPDAAGLTLELQGGAAEGLAFAAKPSGAVTAAEAVATPVVNDDLDAARARIRALNEAVRAVFARIDEIAASGGRELPGDVKRYGPADRCVQPGDAGACLATATLRLTIRRIDAGLASFALEARPVTSQLEADFAFVLGGYLRRGEVPRRGAGQLWVNFHNLKLAAGDAFTGQGFLAAGFASGAVANAATYRMLGFTRDPAVHPPVTGAFSGFRTASGIARVRVAGLADLDPAGADVELGIWRAVVHPTLGARAYGIVANWMDPSTDPATPRGDVPSGQYWFSRACYAPATAQPAFKEWFLCDVGVGPVACVAAQGGTWVDAVGQQVAGEAGATWAGTCALDPEPPELMPPPGAPGDGPGDGSPEAGQTATGLAPPPPPDDPTAPVLTPPAG